MKDAGRTDEYAPDSTQDAVEPGQYFQVKSGKWVLIHVNDFVDCDEDAIPQDPIWGSSFQVAGFEGDNIIIRQYNEVEDLYELIAISPGIINESYVRSPQLDEVPSP